MFQKYLIALAIRAGLLLFGLYIDNNNSLVPYTDVDYFVFSDAAKFVASGQSPYLRDTYRYTPLLAIILTIINGKLLFVAADLFAYFFLNKIKPSYLNDVLWLFNPFVINISTRGSSESVLCMLVLASLYNFQLKRTTLASILFGLAVHVKIYPIVYSLPILIFLPNHKSRLHFFVVSAGTFLSLGGIMFAIYGNDFIDNSFTYHLTRQDHRHNFSVYFYQMYLHYDDALGHAVKLLVFLPQFSLVGAMGVQKSKGLMFCVFTQTFGFVMMNKVCTSQYFMWFLCILPVVLNESDLIRTRRKLGLLLLIAWVFSQALWLFFAFNLEFQLKNTFRQLWASSIILFLVNTCILTSFIKYHRFEIVQSPVRKQLPRKVKTNVKYE